MPVDATFPRLLARRRAEDPGVRALVNDDASITYAELHDTSQARAATLVAAGVGKGDRVGLLMPNGIDWAVTACAVMRIGAILVPLSTLLRPPELVAQLHTAAVTHLITERHYRGRSYLEDLETAAPSLMDRLAQGRRHPAVPFLRHIWVADELTTPDERASGGSELVAATEQCVRPADDMAIMFTSGSRGAPKGVIHTHGNALRAVAASLEARGVGAGDRLYIPMPFFWMGGFAGGLLSVLLAGATLLTESAPEPASTIAFLERERATLFRGWPDQAAHIAADPSFADADLTSLRGASLPAVLPPALESAPGARANLFGMTESFGPYCGDRLDVDLPEDKYGSCGRPFTGIEVRVADLDHGHELAPGEEGEIQLRGPNMMRGICGRDRSTVFTIDGYYPTGDLGRVDPDGYLWYSGRRDDMFKVKGATVYPSEVEAALRAVLEVAQACVTNVTDAAGRDEVAALVVSPLSIDDIVAGVRAQLSAFKVPTRWLVVTDADAVPKSATGKIDVAALRNLLNAQAATVERT